MSKYGFDHKKSPKDELLEDMERTIAAKKKRKSEEAEKKKAAQRKKK